ncbi:MAG: UDP-N-acetylmuramate dehydrogenase, partial [Gammaproteobacteria bacterium]
MDSTSPTTGYALAHDALIPNTLRVSARARLLARIKDAGAVPRLLAETAGERLFVLGGGSNVLFTQDFEGAVLQLVNRGIEDRGDGRVRVAAGERWDGFVRWSLAAGYAGLENLILIPGTVGAAPIQNIGAYGVELAEFVGSVTAWDRTRDRFVELSAADCVFGYRDSVFKHEPERYIVTAVDFVLPRTHSLVLDYRGVHEELAAMGVASPTPADVSRAVERLRLRKLPNPAEIGNAGSFFKNPLVSAATAEVLHRRYPELPVYPAEPARAKLSAAWLIERCGLKGYREGDAGMSD